MQKTVFSMLFLCVLFSATASFAALPEYMYDLASGQFVRTYNMAPVYSPTAAEMLAPKFTVPEMTVFKQLPASQVKGPLLSVLGSTASKAVLVRSAAVLLGRASGVATAVQIVMGVEDLYNWANASPENLANFNGIAPGSNLTNYAALPNGTALQLDGGWYTTQNAYHMTGSTVNLGSLSAVGHSGFLIPGQNTLWVGVTLVAGTAATYSDAWRYNLSAASPPPIPNAATSGLNWWYHEVQANVADPSGYQPYPNMQKGLDLALQGQLAVDPNKAGLTYPTMAELIAEGKVLDAVKAGQDVATATATAQAGVQSQYSVAKIRVAAGTGSQAEVDELKRIKDALDLQAKTEAARKAEEAALAPPPTPPDNIYDISIPLPDKLNIPKLLTDFLASSPLVSMVRSFKVTTLDGTNKLYIGNFWGQEVWFDFSPWEGKLQACGGMLIIIMHGFCILIVIRGW